MITFSSKGQIKKKILTTKVFGVQLWDLTRSAEFNRIFRKAIFQYASLLWNMSTDRYWQSTGMMYLMCAAVSDLTVILWLGKSCLIPRSLFHLISFPQKKKKSTHTFTSYIYRILFHYVANNDIQIYWYTTFTVRVCAFVSVCVCKESSETTESRMKIPCEGALNGLTRQR